MSMLTFSPIVWSVQFKVPQSFKARWKMLSQHFKRKKILPLRMCQLRNVSENISFQNTPLQFLCCTYYFPKMFRGFLYLFLRRGGWTIHVGTTGRCGLARLGTWKKRHIHVTGKNSLYISQAGLWQIFTLENKVRKTAGTHCQFI